MTEGAVVDVRLKYLSSDRDRHGNVRVYFRRPGFQKIRILEPAGTPAFLARYDELLRAPAQKVSPKRIEKGTLGWLARQYETSAAFSDLDPSTQKTRIRLMGHMLEEPVRPGSVEMFKDYPLAKFRLASLEVLRDRKRKLPGAANDRVKALRALFKWAKAARHIGQDIARDLTKQRVVSEGHHTWTLEEIEQYQARHPLGTKANLALRLMLYTGARRSDACRLGRPHMRAGTLRWTAHKNRNRHPVTIEIPVLEPLREALAACPTGDLVFLITEYGQPFTAAGFGNWFKDRCREAGLDHCSAHGLRKAGSTLAAESGATAHQLMAMFGWRSLAEAERYTRAAERKRMAAAGMPHLLAGTQSAPPIESETVDTKTR